MSLFPIFVKLQGRSAVVVGGGNIAAGKVAMTVFDIKPNAKSTRAAA